MTERIGFIGGGIFGITLARALAQAGAGDVTVFEKEHRLAAHQTGHNSGVVHAGPYFAEGSLKAQLRVAGGTILLEQEVVAMAVDGGTVRVGTAGTEHVFDRVIACAGLQSDVVARMAGTDPSPKILPFRGEYWSLNPARWRESTGGWVPTRSARHSSNRPITGRPAFHPTPRINREDL